MSEKLKEIIHRAEHWSDSDQDELAEYAKEIETRRSGTYHATPEELVAIDAADKGGIATEEQVAAAFRAFRQA